MARLTYTARLAESVELRNLARAERRRQAIISLICEMSIAPLPLPEPRYCGLCQRHHRPGKCRYKALARLRP
jgi:hypothetical protein